MNSVVRFCSFCNHLERGCGPGAGWKGGRTWPDQGLGGHKGAGAGQASSSRGPGPVQGGRAPGHQATLSLTTVRDTYNDNTLLEKLTNPHSNFDKYF